MIQRKDAHADRPASQAAHTLTLVKTEENCLYTHASLNTYVPMHTEPYMLNLTYPHPLHNTCIPLHM